MAVLGHLPLELVFRTLLRLEVPARRGFATGSALHTPTDGGSREFATARFGRECRFLALERDFRQHLERAREPPRTRDSAEVAGPEDRLRAAPVHAIEEVDEFEPQLQVDPFGERGRLFEGHVPVH